MKRFPKKGILLFAGALAVCAFVLPSMTSAASWSPIAGSDHVIDSPNLGLTSVVGGAGLTASCTSSSFTAVVVNAQDLQIRAGAFGGCTASGAFVGDCTYTATPTGFPWTATGVTTSNIQIHGIHIDLTFEDMPARPGSCTNLNGGKLTVTGTLTGGNATGNGRMDFNNAEGLVIHSALFNNAQLTVRGLYRDTNSASTLTLS
jgi:hypothetical protein